MRVILILLLWGPFVFAGDGDPPRTERKEVPAVTDRCAELSTRIEKLLGPRFPRAVPVYVIDEDFIARFARETEEQLVPKRVRDAAEKLAVRLKQVPAGYDVTEAQLRLLRRMVAGLYDPDAKCYYVVEGKGEPGGMSFDMTAAHELGHAYRDVDKDYWKRTKDSMLTDEDRAIAVTCLVEGDAELIGQSVGIAANQGGDVAKIIPSVITSAKFAPQNTAAAAASPLMREFPLVLRETLVTRYLIGQAFAAAIYEKGGWKALEQAFDDPPRSTEQVLHPAKYLGPDTDEPTRFSGGDPAAALGDGWATLYTNTMGEFMVRVHLTEGLGRRRATDVAEGWDGARYHLCEKKGEPLFFGLVSTWDSEADAVEFARGWADWASLRDDASKPCEVVTAGAEHRIATVDGLVVVRRAGQDVFVMDGVPVPFVEKVAAALRASTREG